MKNLLPYLLATLGFIFSIGLKAQLSHPHFISLNVGTNIPLGEYQDVDSIATGTASNGIYYSLEGAFFVSKVFGFGANLGAFANPVEEKDIVEQLESDFGNPNQNFEIKTSEWVNGYAMIGPYLSFGTKKLRLDLKLLGGMISSQKPLVDYSTTQNGVTIKSVSEEVNSTNFGFNYGMHLRIQLIKKLGLRINAEGFATEQEFETKIKSFQGGTESESEVKLRKEIQAFNLGAGLVLTF